MKDAECAESKEKSFLKFFRSLFLKNWFLIRFSTLHIFHEKDRKTEGEVCISLLGTGPKIINRTIVSFESEHRMGS